jgi:hypothetical protein
VAHDTQATARVEQGLSPQSATIERAGATPEDGRARQPVLQQAGDDDRRSLLRSLYARRSELTRARRLGELSPRDEQRLVEVNEYIDFYEEPLQETGAQDQAWRKLEELAGSLLSAQAALERAKK